MTAEAPAPTPTTEPTRVGRLLDLVRKLIDYGKELATALRHHSATIDLAAATRPFGTRDIALILARITLWPATVPAHSKREWFATPPAWTPHPARAPRPPSRSPLRPRAHRPRLRPIARLAYLPTPEQIAAEVRRRPIGAVIADICRDLGIMPSHPLWREVQMAMIRYGGSLANLVRDLIHQSFQSLVSAAAPAVLAAPSPLPSPTGAGPP